MMRKHFDDVSSMAETPHHAKLKKKKYQGDHWSEELTIS